MEAVVDDFSKFIKGTKVLDLGCGFGQDSYLFQERGFEVTGLDYSYEMIKQAKKLKNVDNPPTFSVGDIRSLPQYFQPNQFDVVWSSASLIHINYSDIDRVFQELILYANLLLLFTLE